MASTLLRSLLAAALFTAVPAIAATPRHLSGTVTGSDGQPVAQASVKLQNGKTKQITSRITDKEGHFRFNRIPTETPIVVWATWHQAKSGEKRFDRFNTDKDLTVDLSIPSH